MTTTSLDDALLGRARDAGLAARRDYAARLEIARELDARQVADAAGYRSTTRLLEDLWTLDPAAAARLVRHAHALAPRVTLTGEPLAPDLPATAAAVTAGRIGPEQIEIIDQTMTRVRDIPDLEPEDDPAAEKLLADAATGLAPAGLRKVAERLIQRLDPDSIKKCIMTVSLR